MTAHGWVPSGTVYGTLLNFRGEVARWQPRDGASATTSGKRISAFSVSLARSALPKSVMASKSVTPW